MRMPRIVRPEELETQEPFETMFDIQPDVLDAIRESIKKGGFDGSKPIDVWEGLGIVVEGRGLIYV